jgi:esterase
MFLSQINYAILGKNENERVVFVHGMMAFAANWRKIATRLEDDYQCLIYDQRGHGRSFKPETGYSPEHFAEDLNKITDELGWTHFHLVGHSMGGRNVMVFAHRYPHKVRTLTIEDMGADKDEQSVTYYQNMLDRVPTPFSSKEAVRAFFSQDFEKNFRSKEPLGVLSTFLQANLEERTNSEGQVEYDWRFSKTAIYEIVREGHSRDRWLEVASFKMPVLLIRGELSHVFKAETYKKMLAVNPNIQGVEVPNTGHWVHYERHEEFVRLLRDFFRDSTAV